MAQPTYLLDSYAKTLHAEVTVLKDATHVILDDTVFYAQGGGQPSDVPGKQPRRHVRVQVGYGRHSPLQSRWTIDSGSTLR